jgi:uncharacterized membrane protein YuzA (DUF378 family)
LPKIILAGCYYSSIGTDPTTQHNTKMAEKLFGDNTLLLHTLWLAVAIGALNWGLVGVVDTNLLADTIGLSNDMLTGAYAVIGGAGAVTLYNTVFVDIMED